MKEQCCLPNHLILEQIRSMIADGHTVTLRVKGYSMRPFLEHKRDKVILSPAKDLQPGDAVLAQISARKYVLHRIIGHSGNRLTLMGDGNIKGTENCSTDDVIAVVTAYIYPNGTIPAHDKDLCRRIRLWNRMRPMRRILLLAYRLMIRIKGTKH